MHMCLLLVAPSDCHAKGTMLCLLAVTLAVPCGLAADHGFLGCSGPQTTQRCCVLPPKHERCVWGPLRLLFSAVSLKLCFAPWKQPQRLKLMFEIALRFSAFCLLHRLKGRPPPAGQRHGRLQAALKHTSFAHDVPYMANSCA